MPAILYFVVPCYNDEDTLTQSVPVFIKKLDSLISLNCIHPNSKLLLVNDGSEDNTWNIILALKEKYAGIIAVNLVQNVGEQNALLAGLSVAVKTADCVITMDSDLQDDIDAADEMLKAFEQGFELVLGVRNNRNDDSLVERLCSGCFYKIMNLAGTGLINQHSNYRLMSKKAAEHLLENFKEAYFLPCFVSNMPFKSTVVYHKRFQRIAGRTGYNFKKKLRLAFYALLIHSDLPTKSCVAFSVAFCLVFFGTAVLLAVKSSRQGVVSAAQSLVGLIALFCCLFSSAMVRRLKKKKSALLNAQTSTFFQIKEVIH